MRTRAFLRATPRSPVTVAFEELGQPYAYGAVSNISEGGACVWTGARFDVGQQLTVRVSAARQPQPLEAPAVVVWGNLEPGHESNSHRYGLQWVEPTPACRGSIRRMLSLPH